MACLKNNPKLVTPEQNERLLQPFSQDDLEEALKQLPNGKVAGLDGVPTEAIKLLWTEIDPLILQQFEETLEKKQIHPSFNRGLQSLIPKGGCKIAVGELSPYFCAPGNLQTHSQSDGQ